MTQLDDPIDWIADRGHLLVSAWTPLFATEFDWNESEAHALASELHSLMLEAMLGNGNEVDFLQLAGKIGLPSQSEEAIAERFYLVTLKLAQSALRKKRGDRIREVLPYLRAVVVGDSRTNPGHLALHGIILPRGHAFWSRRHPPLDMDCRCTTIAMTTGQFARLGRPVTSSTDLAEREARLSGSWPTSFEPLLEFRG